MPGFETVGAEELAQLQKLFSKGWTNLYRYGPDNWAVTQLEEEFAKFMGVKYAHAVSSGTAAIHCALAASGIGPGDEVITTSFTFVAPIEAITALGATAVPVDIDETYHLDPEAIKKVITPKTKAIVSIPMWEAPQMSEILAICKEKGLPLIEDSAQGLGATYQGQKLGTFGQVGSFSFDMGKSMTVGEGGMVITNDKDMYDRVAEYSDHGHMHVPGLPRGEDPRRTPGLNYRMSELSGAVGLAQIAKLPGILETQRKNTAYLIDKTKDLPIKIRKTLPETEGTGDTFIFQLESPERTQEVTAKLKEKGMGSKILPEAFDWHFAGSWNHIFTEDKGYPADLIGKWKSTHEQLTSSIALPLLYKMTTDDLDQIAQKLQEAL